MDACIHPEDYPKSDCVKFKREYTIHYRITNVRGTLSDVSSTVVYDGWEDKTVEISKEHQEYFKEDPNYKLLSIYSKSSGEIDWELNNRMRAVREMCELGHRIRAEAKIRNRQPLRTAYVIFSDQKIQDHMIYIDCGRMEYANIFADELNVSCVEFIEGDKSKFFDYDLKPNFRVLGPKGVGKKVQALKGALTAMSVDEKNSLYSKLKAGNTEIISDIELVMDDLEVVFMSKKNYASATGKVGAIILDTSLDTNLTERGFVAEFRSAIQNIRKITKLNLTDKIFLEVFCSAIEANILTKYLDRLKKDLLATGIDFFPPEEADNEKAHEVSIDDKKYHVHLYKEA
jgi:isoleucyl-tRNA synthetase